MSEMMPGCVNVNVSDRKIGLSIKRLAMEDEKSLLKDYVDNSRPATSAFGELLRENLQEGLGGAAIAPEEPAPAEAAATEEAPVEEAPEEPAGESEEAAPEAPTDEQPEDVSEEAPEAVVPADESEEDKPEADA